MQYLEIDSPGGSQTSVLSIPEGSTTPTSIVRTMTHVGEERTCPQRCWEASCQTKIQQRPEQGFQVGE